MALLFPSRALVLGGPRRIAKVGIMKRIGVGFYGLLPDAASSPKLARAVEENGFDIFAVGDTHTLSGDPYVHLATAAMATRSVRIGPMVTNPITRHVAATANAIATLHDLSGGRAFLGIGTGDNAVLNLGLPRASLRSMERSIEAIKLLVRGESAVVDDATIVNMWSRRAVPVFMTAEGPRSLRLAGRIADGVVVGSGVSGEAVAMARQWIAEGAESAGRSMDEIEVWFTVRWALTEDRGAALRDLASLLAASAHHALRLAPADKGVPAELVPRIEELVAQYQPSHHVVPGRSPNAVAAERLGLLDYLGDRFAIVGTPERCADRLRELADLGVDGVMLAFRNTGSQMVEIEQWGTDVIPLLAR